jgi:hypothetical protein
VPAPPGPEDQRNPSDEALEVRLCRQVAVDAAEVGRRDRLVVFALVVHRAVEEIERFQTQLEPDLVGDRRRLREVHVHLPVARAAELVVPEHRGAALVCLADHEDGL